MTRSVTTPNEERMKDELFTMTPEMPAMSPEMLARWQEELRRNSLRMKHFSEMVMNPKEPEVGPTPREEIYRKGKSRLWRYASKRTHKTPLLFVPNLGISRPVYLRPHAQGPFIEHMTEQGFDFYLVDWGVFGPEDNDLTLEYAVTKILPRLARKALESSGAKEMSVLGYCMGAPLSMSWLASTPEFPVKNFIDMAGPIDFSQVGLFGLWLDGRYFDVDKIRRHAGGHTGRHGQDGLQAPQAHHGSLHEHQPLVEPVESGVRGRIQRAEQVGQRVSAVSRRVLPAVGEGVLPAEQALPGSSSPWGAARCGLGASAVLCSRWEPRKTTSPLRAA